MIDLSVWIGGRGRNRTYNLSVKSRMLCQLSYASGKSGFAVLWEGPRTLCARLEFLRPLEKYNTDREQSPKAPAPHPCRSQERLHPLPAQSPSIHEC